MLLVAAFANAQSVFSGAHQNFGPVDARRFVGAATAFFNGSLFIQANGYIAGSEICTTANGLCGGTTPGGCPTCAQNVTLDPLLIGNWSAQLAGFGSNSTAIFDRIVNATYAVDVAGQNVTREGQIAIRANQSLVNQVLASMANKTDFTPVNLSVSLRVDNETFRVSYLFLNATKANQSEVNDLQASKANYTDLYTINASAYLNWTNQLALNATLDDTRLYLLQNWTNLQGTAPNESVFAWILATNNSAWLNDSALSGRINTGFDANTTAIQACYPNVTADSVFAKGNGTASYYGFAYNSTFYGAGKIRSDAGGTITADNATVTGNLSVAGDAVYIASTRGATIPPKSLSLFYNKALNGQLQAYSDSGNLTLRSGSSSGFGSSVILTARSGQDSIQFNVRDAEKMRLDSSGRLGIGTTTVNNTLTVVGNAWFSGDVSALTFTDRTPYYEGNAIEEIMRIKGKNGELDHSTLPAFAQKNQTASIYEDREKNVTRTGEDGTEYFETVNESVWVRNETVQGRDLGAMISILTTAVQQLEAKNAALELRVKDLEAKAK